MRCKRERLACFFSPQRRKRYDGEEDDHTKEMQGEQQQIGRKRKLARRSSLLCINSPAANNACHHPVPLTPGGSIGRPMPLRRPERQGPTVSDEEDQAASDGATAILQNSEMLSGHDALTTASAASGIEGARKPSDADAQELNEAIKAWSEVKFVRSGWFTALEGFSYIDYFYRFMSPLTPITVANFQSPKTHHKLLCEEPMLAATILTISSRHMALTGPGSNSRAYTIHEKLWSYLKSMIDRIIWGQEQFGGSSCNARYGMTSKSSFRTLGTIESLLLLTEWHPRALHFPPGDDNDEVLIAQDTMPKVESTPNGLETVNMLDSNLPPGIDGKKVDKWLEPCWRSDRLCWSLLAHALALAYELGVMDNGASKGIPEHAKVPGSSLERRRLNLRRLLYVYLTQTSGRLSLPSPLPKSIGKALFEQDIRNRESPTAGVAPESPESPVEGQTSHEMMQKKVLDFWFKIALLFARGNAEIFPSRDVTREIINSGRYREILDRFEGMHKKWRQEFDACTVSE